MELLKERGITQEQFSVIAGVTLSTAQRWLHGKQKPSLAPWEFFSLAKRLGVSPLKLSQMMREAYEKGQQNAETPPKKSKKGGT